MYFSSYGYFVLKLISQTQLAKVKFEMNVVCFALNLNKLGNKQKNAEKNADKNNKLKTRKKKGKQKEKRALFKKKSFTNSLLI